MTARRAYVTLFTRLILATVFELRREAESSDSSRLVNANEESAPRHVDSAPMTRPPETGMAEDLRLFRETIIDPQSGLRLSSPEAKQATRRVLGRVNFVGMTRAHALWMLGDPETLSDYGRKPKPEKDASMVYCFNNDDGGRCDIVKFENERVTHVHGKPKSDE